MTYPRAHLIDPNGGTYHLVSRCVRRAFLCGDDPNTGYNFNHRRRWLEKRIHFLSKIFCVDLIGYAIMSNHYHLVLSVDPGQADALTDTEVIDKWRQLFPKRKAKLKELKSRPEIEQLQTKEILQLRTRLASLSWFMRCLNEPLARIANKEDECTGRFWEGRFKSQLILDEAALLACMAYVDLNPVRANIASTAEDSHYTSIRARLTQEETSDQLVSLNNKKLIGAGYSLNEYLKFLRWTMWSQRSVRASAQKPLDKLSATHGIDTLLELMPKPGGWQRAIGQPGAIKGYAKSIGQRWIKTAA